MDEPFILESKDSAVPPDAILEAFGVLSALRKHMPNAFEEIVGHELKTYDYFNMICIQMVGQSVVERGVTFINGAAYDFADPKTGELITIRTEREPADVWSHARNATTSKGSGTTDGRPAEYPARYANIISIDDDGFQLHFGADISKLI